MTDQQLLDFLPELKWQPVLPGSSLSKAISLERVEDRVAVVVDNDRGGERVAESTTRRDKNSVVAFATVNKSGMIAVRVDEQYFSFSPNGHTILWHVAVP